MPVKKIYTYFLVIFLFLASFSFQSVSYAQSWVWGKAANNGSLIDSWPVATDASGNVFGAGVAAGGTVKFGSLSLPSGTIGAFQAVWVKYDPTGVVLWAGATSSGNVYIFNITTDLSGNLILFGYFTSTTMQIGSFTLTNTYPTGYTQYYLAKIDPAGTVLWAVNDGNVNQIGPSVFITSILGAGGVATDVSGNIYITAAFSKKTMTIGSTTLTNTDPSGSSYDVFVAKYNPSGTPVWATSIGGSKDEYAFGATVSSTGDVYIAGDFLSPSISVGSSVISNPYLNTRAYIAEFSGSTGAPLWAQNSGGKKGSFSTGLAHDNSGNVYMTGGFADTTITFGATTVSRPYPPKFATQSALFLVQYSPANTVTWDKAIASPNQGVWGYTIGLASCGEVWVSGNYDEAAVIDVGDTLQLVKNPHDPVFIAGYDLSGGVVGYAGLTSGGDDQNGIACDASGNVFMCSDFFPSTPFIVGPDTLNTTTAGSESFYIAKYANFVKPPDTIGVHKDTSICSKIISMTLTAPAGYATYYWDNGSGATTRTVTTSGTYYVYCVTCGVDVLADTFSISVKPPDTAYTHIDTSVCSSIPTVTLSGPPGAGNYLWSNGSIAPSINVTTAGTYFVVATSPCELIVDTFRLTKPQEDTAGTQVNNRVCASETPLALTAPSGYTSWLWNTGSTAASITASVASVGTYLYTLYNRKACSVFIDSFNIVVDSVPVVFLGNDTTICAGSSIELTSPAPPDAQYTWGNGSNAPKIEISNAGIYSLTISLHSCVASNTINISEMTPPVISLGPDTVLCIGQEASLTANTTSAGSLLWNTGQRYPNITTTESGAYWATISNECGVASDTINVEFVVCDLWFPSAFTPNGDGKNDIARVIGFLEFYKDFSLSIFNRYGQRVFYTEDIYAGWDGTYNGTKQDLGTYFYLINYSLQGKHRMMKGDFELIR